MMSSPQPLLMPTGGSPSLMTTLPTITPGLSAPPTSMPILQPQAPMGASLPPPPKAGFQPVPHSLHDYESHHSPPLSQVCRADCHQYMTNIIISYNRPIIT